MFVIRWTWKIHRSIFKGLRSMKNISIMVTKRCFSLNQYNYLFEVDIQRFGFLKSMRAKYRFYLSSRLSRVPVGNAFSVFFLLEKKTVNPIKNSIETQNGHRWTCFSVWKSHFQDERIFFELIWSDVGPCQLKLNSS